MTETIAQRVHRLLTESMDLPTDQRRQFLREACAEDSRLNSQFERLLLAIDDSHSFLERPALASVASDLWQVEQALPERIGNYRIIQQLGSGGMGTVYEAIQDQPQRTVALKIPRRRQWNARLQEQLKVESEILGRLRHPHIAQVFEAGIDHSNPLAPIAYFAMEFVPGARTLSSYLRQKPFSVDEILQMMIKICDAVQHGHRLGIIHCDLKPANILVDSEGNPKIIDFGVANSRDVNDHVPGENRKLAEPATGSARSNVTLTNDLPGLSPNNRTPNGSPGMFGTLNYMSPEQCDGREFPDARTDVYSLGVVLYQMLCDDLPFDLKGLRPDQAMQVICQQPYRQPRREHRVLGRDLLEILRKSLNKDREQRYSTADALAADLQRVLANFPVAARAATPWYVGCRFVQRNRWLVGASFLLLLAIVASLVTSATFAYRTSVESERRRHAEQRASRERDDAVWQSYVANMAAGFAAFTNVSQMRSHVAAASEQHRDWEWHFLNAAIQSGERVVPAHRQMIQVLAVNDDGTLAATGAEDGRVRLWDTATWRMMLDIPRPKLRKGFPASKQTGVSSLAFRNGDRQIVSGMTDGSIRIWNTGTGDLIHELAGHQHLVSSLAIHSDGTIVSACWGNQCRLWKAADIDQGQELQDPDQLIRGAIFCDEGKKLLTWSLNGSILLRDFPSLEVLEKFQHPGDLRRVAVTKDGNLIVAGTKDSRVHFFRSQAAPEDASQESSTADRATREKGTVITLPGNRSSTDSLCFSEDGSLVVIGRVDRRIEVLHTSDLTTAARFRGHDDFVSGVWVNPQGSQLISVSGDGTVRIWPIRDDPERGNISVSRQDDERVFDISFAPDSVSLASAGEKSIRIWDSDLRNYEEPIPGTPGGMHAVAFSPDGNLLAAGGADHVVRVTNLKTKETRNLSIQHSRTIKSLTFSLDNRWLVSADAGGMIFVWNLDWGHLKFGQPSELSEQLGVPAHRSTVNQVRFSRDGKLLASASNDRSVRVWDFEKRTLIMTLDGHHLSDVFAVVFSPDGNLLYSGSRDRTIAIWSLRTGELVDTLTSHRQLIRCLDINPAGTRLVAGSWFGDILMWDLKRHELVATFKAHTDIIHAIKFDPVGRSLATCSYDRTIRLHQADHSRTFDAKSNHGTK